MTLFDAMLLIWVSLLVATCAGSVATWLAMDMLARDTWKKPGKFEQRKAAIKVKRPNLEQADDFDARLWTGVIERERMALKRLKA